MLGYPVILGVKDENIFLANCYEGCGNLQMFSEGRLFKIQDIFDRNKIISRDLFVLNHRVIIVDEHKIYEFNSDNLTLKILKEISEDKVFGGYGEFAGEFYADYKIDGNFIKYNIYNKKAVEANFGSGL